MDITTRFALACLAVGCGVGVAATESLAHGSMEKPISRIYRCFLEGPEAPKTDACQALVDAGGTQPLYDWMEVNQFEANGAHKSIVPDGTLCAGGREKYVGLDLPRKDWRKSTITPNSKGKYTFVFHASTPHATRYFKFYITRDSWKRGDRLSWSNIRRVATKRNQTAKNNRYTMRFKLPSGTQGRHVVYAIWQRSDSREAFYSCSDVKVVPASSGASPVAAASWSEEGDVIAHNALETGSTVSFRVFDKSGGDVETHTITVDRRSGAADSWPSALARKVNARSEVFRIGSLDDEAGELAIEPVGEAAGNAVYRSAAYPGYSYHIDIDTPAR
ncbi:lytic polysaccharide monooxygenase auxiliary activity family 9 protein [Microbaculum marinum]|uniref:Lytic polysaccharide monooxygenase n=1 Tax=Microbaculum marinum TaxID=1764581 RepID=A0AAW9RLX5_9HYPH